MGNKWRKVKMLLGLRVCAIIPPDPEEVASPSSGKISQMNTATLATSTSDTPIPHCTSATSSHSLSARYLAHNAIRISRSPCSICLETMKPGHGHALFTAECSHTFHFSCIASNVRYGNLVCPVCRAKWKEVPWPAPVERRKCDRSRGSVHSSRRNYSATSGTTIHTGRASTISEEQRVCEPVLNILDANIANSQPYSQHFPIDPRLYNDDEPLMHSISDARNCTRSMLEDEIGSSEGKSEMSNSMIEGSTNSIGCLNGTAIESKSLDVIRYPEVSVVGSSETVESFTALVHLKAPIVSNGHQVRRKILDSINPLQPKNVDCRVPIDLVTVLDVSGSMAGTKLALVKQAMAFVIGNLSSADRLSIVAFSSSAKRILPLRRMVEEGRQHALLAVDALVCTGGTNIAEGLRKGAKVLEDRCERNPVSSIILLSDGEDTYNIDVPRSLSCTLAAGNRDYQCLLPESIGPTSNPGQMQIPVHTFGFGTDHHAATMHAIAEVSGGTFSFIQAEGVQDAFAQCIGGLLSVVIQDLQLKVSCCTPGVQISKVEAGSYDSSVFDSANCALISLRDLYAEEERDLLVELKLPLLFQSNCDLSLPALKVGCIYKDPVTQAVIHTPTCELCIPCPTIADKEQQEISLQVNRQRNRLLTAQAIADARSLADMGDISGAQDRLLSARTVLQNSPAAMAGDQLCNSLESELAEIQMRIVSRQLYERSGRAYLLSAQSSHLRQRATTRGETVEGHMQDYQTPSMVDMILQSQSISFNSGSMTGWPTLLTRPSGKILKVPKL
eukprot:c22998_g2_i1 orf=358-2715(+)